MAATKYLQELRQTHTEIIEVSITNMPFDDGNFLGVWHGDYVYCDKYKFKHPEGGLRGFSYVYFKVEDKNLKEIILLETSAHKLTPKETEQIVVNNLSKQIQQEIDKKIMNSILKSYKEEIKAIKHINDYPIGTRYPSINGGYWIKTGSNHFKWCNGNTFPTVGGDWNGKVILPKAKEFDFTTPCLIRKVNEHLIISLEELGYGLQEEILDENLADVILTDPVNSEYSIKHYDSLTKEELEQYVDCEDNETLFLAIAALRNDSDYKQWFVNEEPNHWVNQGLYQESGPNNFCLVDKFHEDGKGYHKATIKELIMKYKMKQ